MRCVISLPKFSGKSGVDPTLDGETKTPTLDKLYRRNYKTLVNIINIRMLLLHDITLALAGFTSYIPAFVKGAILRYFFFIIFILDKLLHQCVYCCIEYFASFDL